MYGQNRYKKTRVTTATREELVVMLYDGVLKNIDLLHAAMEDQLIAEASQAVDKCLDILGYLQATLRPEVAPELCQHLTTAYEAWSRAIVRCRIQTDTEDLAKVRVSVAELRDAWAEAAREIATTKAA